jgi:large repetitive protein
VTFTATLTPITATGTIQFNIGGSTIVTGSLANGIATYATNLLPLGTTQVMATYSGDTNFAPGSSPIYTQTVTRIATSVSVSSSPNPSLVGQNVTFTATVSPASATGSVTFTIGITNVIASLNNGVATYVTNTLPSSVYPATATYGGNAIYSPGVSSGQYTHTVTNCNPLVVTNSIDDGTALTCGTFSYAILSASTGTTITFAVTNITMTGVLTPTLQAGVVIDGGANGATLDGGTLNGDGLRLGGDNRLINLVIKGFNGRGLVMLPDKTNNKLDRVKVTKI